MGRAKAILVAGDMRNQGPWWIDDVVLCTHGSPRVGNTETDTILSQSTRRSCVSVIQAPIPHLPSATSIRRRSIESTHSLTTLNLTTCMSYGGTPIPTELINIPPMLMDSIWTITAITSNWYLDAIRIRLQIRARRKSPHCCQSFEQSMMGMG